MAIIGGSGIIPSGGGIAPSAGGGAGADLTLTVPVALEYSTFSGAPQDITVTNSHATLPGAVRITQEGLPEVRSAVAFTTVRLVVGVGTITWSDGLGGPGNVITGVGTSFLTDCDVGDQFGTPTMVDIDVGVITSITSDTEMTVDGFGGPVLTPPGEAYELSVSSILEGFVGPQKTETFLIASNIVMGVPLPLPAPAGQIQWNSLTITGNATSFLTQTKVGDTISATSSNGLETSTIVSVDNSAQLTMAVAPVADIVVDTGYGITTSVDLVATFSDGEVARTSAICTLGGSLPTSYANPGAYGDRTIAGNGLIDIMFIRGGMPLMFLEDVSGNATPASVLIDDWPGVGVASTGIDLSLSPTGGNPITAGDSIMWVLQGSINGGKKIDEILIYQSAAASHGNWRVSGSNDMFNWDVISNNFVLGSGALIGKHLGSPFWESEHVMDLIGASATYIFYALELVSGSVAASNIVEIEFKISA